MNDSKEFLALFGNDIQAYAKKVGWDGFDVLMSMDRKPDKFMIYHYYPLIYHFGVTVGLN